MAAGNPFKVSGVNPPPGNPFGSPSDDDEFVIDLSNAESQIRYTPAGTFLGKLIDVERQTSSSSGNPMIVWQFEVIEGQYAGTQTRIFTTLTPKAIWKAQEVLSALNLGGDDDTVKFKKADALGRLATLVVAEREYQGRMIGSLDQVLPPSLEAVAKYGERVAV